MNIDTLTQEALTKASDALSRFNHHTRQLGGVDELAEKVAQRAGGKAVELTPEEANAISWAIGMAVMLSIATHEHELEQAEYENELAERFDYL